MTNADYIQQLNSIKIKHREMIKKMSKNILLEISDINGQYLNTFSKYKVGDVIWTETKGKYELHQITKVNFHQHDDWWFKHCTDISYIERVISEKVVESDLFIFYTSRKYQTSGKLGVTNYELFNIEDGLKIGDAKDLDTPIKVRNQFKLCKDNK
jgi:hypothetical protein